MILFPKRIIAQARKYFIIIRDKKLEIKNREQAEKYIPLQLAPVLAFSVRPCLLVRVLMLKRFPVVLVMQIQRSC
jgi:hypothetical protein